MDPLGSLTYAELNHRVLLLAEYLRQQGAGPDKTVAVLLPPCVDSIVAYLAVLSAGGCFITLELSYPAKLMAAVLQDGQPVTVITDLANRHKLSGETPIFLIDGGLSRLKAALDQSGGEEKSSVDALEARRQAAPKATLDNLAFIVYSSGTTGEPKGISNPHRAPTLSYDWRFKLNDLKVGDRVGCNVFFIWEAFRPLIKGATTFCIPSDIIYDVPSLLDMLQEHHINEILFTPTLISNALATASLKDLRAKTSSLRTILLNGEVVSTDLAQRILSALPELSVFNLYSISECHEVAMTNLKSYDLNSFEYCPVGVPSPLTPAFVLDDGGNKVPEGEVGELYVGGPLLARGYLNRPEMTAERFPPNTQVDASTSGFGYQETRMYRTGDLAKFLPNGMIQILGRAKFMVKVRGYTVVLSKIEQEIMDAVDLKSCAVVTVGEEGTEKRLLAYLVPNDSETVSHKLQSWTINPQTGHCSQIRKVLKDRLPHYMIPTVYSQIESLPYTPAGKLNTLQLQKSGNNNQRSINRSLMLAPGVTSSSRFEILYKFLTLPPGSPEEAVRVAMLSIWDGINSLPDGTTELDSDFMELGGQSLSATRLTVAIKSTFGVKFSAASVLGGASPNDLVEAVLRAWETDQEEGNVDLGQSEGKQDVPSLVREAAKLPDNLCNFRVVPADPISLADATAVFLTGSTGFFGAHILAELLENTSACVTCLVRSRNGLEAIVENLRRYRLYSRVAGAVKAGRVEALLGDLSAPKFGLLSSQWAKLASSTDSVIHCAAAVSLGAAWTTLKEANIGGTLQVIQLACEAKPGCQMVHVSTNGIFPGSKQPISESIDISSLPDELDNDNGYGLTKWAAETLVRTTHLQCGLPVVVFRVGNLGWHAVTGSRNELDFQSMLIAGCCRLGVAPDMPNAMVEMTPVNYAASSLMQLATSANAQTGKVFHIAQPSFTPWNMVLQWLDELLAKPLRRVVFSDFRAVIDQSLQSPSEVDASSLTRLSSLLEGIPGGCDSYMALQPQLDCKEFDTAIRSLSLSPRVGLLPKYLGLFLHVLNPNLLRIPYSPEPAFYSPSPSPILKPMNPPQIADPSLPLNGKVAVVTGASSGIGRGIAVALAKAGCSVALAARRVNELKETQATIEAERPNAQTLLFKTDVTKREDVISLVAKAEQTLGPVDFFINNAGVMYFTLMKNVVWDQWDRTIDVNCKGTTNGIGAILPRFLARGKGHIVNITSDAGRKAFAGLAVYSGSKFYVEAMSQALRLETASTGVKVTCIQPGNVATPLLATSTDKEGLEEYGTPTGAKVLEPDDIGRAVVYAVSQPEWVAVNEILVEPREEPA